MMNPKTLERCFVRVALDAMAQFDFRINTNKAVALVMGTAAQESKLGLYLTQIKGPAISPFQVEPNTHRSLWTHYLNRKSKRKLAEIIAGLAPAGSVVVVDGNFVVSDWALFDLRYSAAMCRLKYWPKSEPIPEATDLHGLGEYWNVHYNANPVHGTVKQFVASWRECMPDWSPDAS